MCRGGERSGGRGEGVMEKRLVVMNDKYIDLYFFASLRGVMSIGSLHGSTAS